MKNFILIIFLFVADVGVAQTVYFASKADKKSMTLYSCGTTAISMDSCYLDIQKNYGFNSKDLGCFVNKKIQKRFDKNNKRVERKLRKQNGKNWKENFSYDVEACRISKGLIISESKLKE